ncbi:peptidoglycan-binding domain-containing protein [Actinophytocola sp.]|uniref:peptidoglycan-binding domain-containing protein n=1 Tax=Actinophytocola sp. TaxID=1872138 RepID=UPI002ED7F8C5
MASEPELRTGGSGEWVLYLQQSLNHHYRQSVTAESGEFDAALEAVVRHFQRQQGLRPTGVADAPTWATLTGTAAPAAQPHPAGHPDHAAADHAGALHGTGVHADQHPASFSEGGAPALKYSWPDIPIASAAVDAGAALVELELTLTGESTVAFPHGPAGATLDQHGLSLAAGAALDGLTNGLSVSNLGSGSPGLSAAVGTEFLQVSAGPLTPNRIEFSGSAHLDYEVATDHGHAKVTGQVGYKLQVTVTPHVQREEAPATDTAPSWVEHHAQDLAAVGLVVLVAAFAIALAPETGGASLILLGA